MKPAHTHPFPILLAFVVLAFNGLQPADAHERLQRGGVDQVATDLEFSLFSLDLMVGLAGLKGFDDTRGTLTVTPRWDLSRRGGQLFALALPVTWIPEEQTHSNGNAFSDVDVAYAEGPSVILAPSLEWYSCPNLCSRPSMFFGAGVLHEERSSPFVALDDETVPLVTLGFSVERPVTRRSALRFEVRGLMTFYDEERLPILDAAGSVVGQGAVIGPDGTTMSIHISVGLKLRPGR